MMGIARLATDTGCPRRTIERHLAWLERHAIIERHRGRGVMAAGGVTTLTILRAPPRYRQQGDGTSLEAGTVTEPTEVPTKSARSTVTEVSDTPVSPSKPPYASPRALEGAHDAQTRQEPRRVRVALATEYLERYKNAELVRRVFADVSADEIAAEQQRRRGAHR